MNKKQTSIYFEEEFIDLLKTRSNKEKMKMNDFVVTAVEKQLLYPFFSWRHLQNYITIAKQVNHPKNESSTRKAFFYIIAYDGILMEYIDTIYHIEDKYESVDIPDDLADLLHPEFDLMRAGYELFSHSMIEGMEDALEWFYTDTDEIKVVLNAVLISKNYIVIEDDLYRYKQANMFPQYNSNKELCIKTFKDSLIYKQCNDVGRELLEELFSFIKENEIEVSIKLGIRDAFTFTLNTVNGSRLAIITLTDDLSSLQIGINKLPTSFRGTITLCRSKYDLQELIYDSIVTKYKELTSI